MQHIIEIKDGMARQPAFRMQEPINLNIDAGEQIAIVGPNGGGKSILVGTIMGKYPLQGVNEVKYDFSPSASTHTYDNIKYIAFRDTYGDADSGYYYQQRWNSQDRESSPVVKDLLPQTDDSELRDHLYGLFGIEEMLDKHIVLLSSGELRKFQLAKTLLGKPRVLVMDNPFIGLDAPTRELLRTLLGKLTLVDNLQVILVLSKSDDVPDFITHVIPVNDMTVGEKISLAEFRADLIPVPSHILSEVRRNMILTLPYHTDDYISDSVACLNKVSIRYGERTILKDLDWNIMRGERWALKGENGAGKSTLLSLICADNPQSYACDISLFGRKRGSGESIWEIKKHIGYVSPEMHRAYMENIPAIEIVASGLHDTVGLYIRMRQEEALKCEFWMEVFGILPLKDKNFLELSSGEQRLCLLARAFVKDPELIILDEPLHGLDLMNRRMVKDIIEAFCQRPDKTMIMVTHYQDDLPDNITNSLCLKKNK